MARPYRIVSLEGGGIRGHLWSWLLRRVVTVEVDTCPEPACGGAMRLVHLASSPVNDRRGGIGVAMAVGFTLGASCGTVVGVSEGCEGRPRCPCGTRSAFVRYAASSASAGSPTASQSPQTTSATPTPTSYEAPSAGPVRLVWALRGTSRRRPSPWPPLLS